MAKKIVRGITDVKTINNQDYDTNNVNDLLSDGQYNYIHRKKGENEEYHNLTDNIKTLSSDNTELLAVTNNNKTTNTATLHPKHDAQKEQLLESTRDTVTINHGTNGIAEKTTVDTNPQKVLEHENLTVGYGIKKETSNNISNLSLEYTTVGEGFDLNEFYNGRVKGGKMLNLPQANTWFLVSAFTGLNYTIQEAVTLADQHNKTFRRTLIDGVWTTWREQVGDKSDIDSLLAQKQDKLTAGTGITIQGQTISASGGATHTIQDFSTNNLSAVKHVVTIGQQELTTFSFECYEDPEVVLTGELKEELKYYVHTSTTISNGALSITNDGTTMKLIKSAQSETVYQHATFTFYTNYGGGGGGDVPPGV